MPYFSYSLTPLVVSRLAESDLPRPARRETSSRIRSRLADKSRRALQAIRNIDLYLATGPYWIETISVVIRY